MQTQLSPRVQALLEKSQAASARLIFSLDATMSREPTWDVASSLQTAMFEQAGLIGNLEVKLAWYRGVGECSSTTWTTDPSELARQMRMMRCEAGATQIARLLSLARAETARKKVNAMVFVGDAVEETPQKLYDAAAKLGVPLFLFQEGNGLALYVDQRGEIIHEHPVTTVEEIFRELARLTGGAYARFDGASAGKLRELLQAVAAFAAGGLVALAGQRTESAQKLLGQMRNR